MNIRLYMYMCTHPPIVKLVVIASILYHSDNMVHDSRHQLLL